MPRIEGVYVIKNARTAVIYIGSSVDIARRWSDHRRELLTRQHKNALLQAAYDCDGVDAFVLGILELVKEVEHLTVREQHYLDLLKPATMKAGLQYERLIGHGVATKQIENGFGARLIKPVKAAGCGRGRCCAKATDVLRSLVRCTRHTALRTPLQKKPFH